MQSGSRVRGPAGFATRRVWVWGQIFTRVPAPAPQSGGGGGDGGFALAGAPWALK